MDKAVLRTPGLGPSLGTQKQGWRMLQPHYLPHSSTYERWHKKGSQVLAEGRKRPLEFATTTLISGSILQATRSDLASTSASVEMKIISRLPQRRLLLPDDGADGKSSHPRKHKLHL